MTDPDFDDPADILAGLSDVYREKNEDYADSWVIAGQLLHLMADGEDITLEDEEDFIRIGLWTRRMDKMVRAFHGEMVKDDGDVNFESIRDSHEDESVYAAMHASTHHDGE